MFHICEIIYQELQLKTFSEKLSLVCQIYKESLTVAIHQFYCLLLCFFSIFLQHLGVITNACA